MSEQQAGAPMSTREQAEQLRAKILRNMESRKGFRRDMIDAVTKNEWDEEWNDIIAAALADARRAVWEEAHEYVKQHHFNVVTSKHATKTCVTLEDYFRAKAQAAQEEG